MAESRTRKPHLLRVKQEIVYLLDDHIEGMQKTLNSKDKGFEKEDREIRRDLTIWIRHRNKIAKDADMEPIPLTEKDGTGKLIYT